MHCDDKRTLFILKENIEKNWKELKESKFDEIKLKEFSDALVEYFDLKKSSKQDLSSKFLQKDHGRL